MEQFEIIDVRDEEELETSWSDFIHTHHFEVHADAYDSWILNHQEIGRGLHQHINQYMNAYFIENNPVPRELNLPGLAEWFQPLFDAEERAA